jgi:hypothetical protein
MCMKRRSLDYFETLAIADLVLLGVDQQLLRHGLSPEAAASAGAGEEEERPAHRDLTLKKLRRCLEDRAVGCDAKRRRL